MGTNSLPKVIKTQHPTDRLKNGVREACSLQRQSIYCIIVQDCTSFNMRIFSLIRCCCFRTPSLKLTHSCLVLKLHCLLRQHVLRSHSHPQLLQLLIILHLPALPLFNWQHTQVSKAFLRAHGSIFQLPIRL